MATKNKRVTLGMGSTPADWEVESDLSCLMRAKEIQADPKRLAAAQKLAKEKMMQAATVATSDGDD